MANVRIGVNTTYNGKGFDQLRKDSKSSAAIVSKALGALGFALGAREILDFAKASEKMGQEMKQARTRLTQLLGSSEAYNRAIADMNKFTTLQGSELENAQNAFLLLDSKIASTTEEAAKLTNAGDILSEVFKAQGASQEKFIRLLSSGNDVLLDNFNLTREQVKARAKEIQATSDLSDNEAKLQAIRQLAIEKADKLSESLDENANAAARFKSASQDLTAAIGEALTPAMTKGREANADFFSNLTAGIKGFTTAGKQYNLITQAQANLNKEMISGLAGREGIQRAKLFIQAMMAQGDEASALAQEYQKLIAVQQESTQSTDENTQSTEDNTEALKTTADQLKKVNEARRKFAHDLIDIDEQAQEDDKAAWDDYFKSEANAWQDHQASIADLKEKGAADLIKIDEKLKKDLAKLAKSTQKSLAKVDKDETKKIKQLKEDSAKKQSQEAKKRQVDTLADQRLFNFELKQLAARGAANQIQEALARRKIEEEIAKDKQQVEAQIEDEKLQDDIKRTKDAAQEKRDELRANSRERRDLLVQEAEDAKQVRQERLQSELEDEAKSYQDRLQQLRDYRQERLAEIEKLQDDIQRTKDAAQEKRDELRANSQERRDELKQEAEDAKQVRQERLQSELEDEAKSYQDRLQQLRDYRQERLAEIEKGKQKAIKALGRELAESQDLTASELQKLVPVAGKFGEEAGVAFADGLKKGTQTLKDIKNLLAPTASPGASQGLGSNPSTLGFQHGGSFTVGGQGGPDSQFVSFRATPGERVTVGNGGGNVNLNPTIVIQGNASSDTIKEIEQALQWYTDNVLAPILS